MMTLIKAMKYYFEGEVPVVLQHSNWTCDLSLFQILFALMSGGTIVLAPTISPVNIWRIMVQHKITATVATPSEYSTWFQQPMNMLSSCDAWRFAFCCGENMSSAVVRNFAALGIGNLQLVTVYGQTETSIACCMGLVEYKEYSADKDGKLVPAGSVLPEYQLWIGDHLGRVLPPAWTGDIWIAGPGVSGGYFGAENVDDHWFQTSETGASSFRTGDAGFLNDNGVLSVVSRRLDESIASIRGYNIELGDISLAIIDKSNGKVAEAVVIVREEHDEEEPHILAFIVMTTASGAESHRYLQGMLRGLNLPAYMRPTRAVIRESLPRTKNGKTDRGSLIAMDVPKSQVIQVIQPASSFGRSQDPLRDTSLPSVEQKVLRMWEQCLPQAELPEHITSTTDFFAIGGTTAMLSRLLQRMRTGFRDTLTMADMAHNATLRGMTTVAMNQINIFTMSTTSVDWPSKTALPTTKKADFVAMASRTGHGLVVLMTGATGFLGRAILECLANASEVALVHCVAIRSLHKTIAHPKILYHTGDLTQPRLGLSSSDWEQLTKSVDIIVHAAALVDCIRLYSSLRTTNVQPTKKLVQFATHRQIPIHYISSAGVGRFVGHITFPEMVVAGYPPPVDADGYTMSKWASESILEKAHTTLGIPVMLHRPTGIIGSSSTTMNMLTDLFDYSKELHAVPTLPEIERAFDIVSVEVMARTIVRDALQPIKGINFSNIGGVKMVPVKDLHIAMAMDTGVQMEHAHLQEWVRKVVQAGMDKEVAHLFEVSDELAKGFVYPEIKRRRDLA